MATNPVLHQIIAVEKGTKGRALSILTEIHKANQKEDLFNGISRNYKPLNDEGEKLPAENTLVQRNAIDVLKSVQKTLTELFDITAQRDYTNCKAIADVMVDGHALVKNAPCTYLLFLEKQLVDVRTVISEMPTLDPASVWDRDPNSNLFRSNAVDSIRTKKDQVSLVLLQPTKEHPGQSQMITKDVPVGTWTTVKLSGALPIPRKEELLDKVEKLLKAVKYAREQANTAEVTNSDKIGDAIFGYLFK